MSTSYHVRFEKETQKALEKMDRFQAILIISWIEKHLEGTTNPHVHGKSFIENRGGQWQYRVGDYRLMAEIKDEEIVILILNIGYRRMVFDK